MAPKFIDGTAYYASGMFAKDMYITDVKESSQLNSEDYGISALNPTLFQFKLYNLKQV